MDKLLDNSSLWVLSIINYSSKQETGISATKIYEKDGKRKDLSLSELYSILNQFKQEKLIDEKLIQGYANPVYFITDKGKKEFSRALKKLNSSEFVDFLLKAPPEINLNYRMYNLEHSLFLAVFGIILLQAFIFLMKVSHIFLALLSLFLSVLFIGISIGHFTNVLNFVIYRYLKSFYNGLNKIRLITQLKKSELIGKILKSINSFSKRYGSWVIYVILFGLFLYWALPILLNDIEQTKLIIISFALPIFLNVLYKLCKRKPSNLEEKSLI